MENKNGLGLTTEETLALAQGMESGPRTPTTKAIKTGIAAANFLYGYPLESPSKKLYFVEDSIRRRIPRKLNETGGTSAHWKQITSINAGKLKAGVAEGAVNTAVTITSAEMSATYKTLNMYNSYSDESRIFGRKFEDIPQLGMLATLQNLMIQEDRYILGGNVHALGAPTGVTCTGAVTSGGALVFGTTYDITVSALTLHGYLNGATGHGTADAADETDVVTTGATHIEIAPGGSNNSFTVTWNDVPGAFAYNVYISTHATGTPFYLATVTKNAYTILANKTSGNVANTADQTADTLGYSGIMEQLTYGAGSGPSATGVYYKSLDGAALTTDGAGGVAEVETALQSIWNNYRVSPTAMFINSQESKSFKKLAIGSSTANAVRITVTPDGKNEFGAGAAVNAYWSPYTAQWIQIVTSVHMPPGKVMLLGESVPYPDSETPNNFEVELQQEYYGEMFARTSRTTPVGVTCIGALKVYLPGACGIISNCAAA
ncbi:MAG: hypothetical protein A9183_03040 [Dehalococcoides mccartyi]|uniref:hypothetical protein n=1 Tax=Dehalococcoides mccartyi TaxID=61435 RepID=UPI000804F598|nr:hypothetical protein [Dehalococcoides mccartyi]OBW61094.1 MAG: hypothetical protein A9183_03040 [Dehalococcoides mccartyi]